MVEKYGFEILGSKVKGVKCLKFKKQEDANKIRRKVGGRVVKSPLKVLKLRKLYFKKKDGSYGYL